MAVIVEATGSLRPLIPPGTVLEDVWTVGQAIERLRIPSQESVIMLVNRRVAHWKTELHDGDVLQLMPAIGGG